MVHGIKPILDAHLDWVVFQVNIANVFNIVSCQAIFQELWVLGGQLSQLFPFVRSFYGLQVLLYLSHHSSLGVLLVILSFMGTQQGNLLAWLLFVLVHFCTLRCSSGVFLSCFFLSLANNTHIFSLAHVVSFPFDHFASQFATMGLFIQFCKCLTWALFILPPRFIPSAEFCCLLSGMKILGVLFGFAFFASFFLQ